MNKCLICDKEMTIFRDCGGGVSIYCGEHGTPLEQVQKMSARIAELERTVDELRGELAQSDRASDKARIAELEEALRKIVSACSPAIVCMNCEHCWNSSVIDYCEEKSCGDKDPHSHSCSDFSPDDATDEIIAIAQSALGKNTEKN